MKVAINAQNPRNHRDFEGAKAGLILPALSRIVKIASKQLPRDQLNIQSNQSPADRSFSIAPVWRGHSCPCPSQRASPLRRSFRHWRRSSSGVSSAGPCVKQSNRRTGALFRCGSATKRNSPATEAAGGRSVAKNIHFQSSLGANGQSAGIGA